MATLSMTPLKPVQELLLNGIVPSQYVQPENEIGKVADATLPIMDTSTVDVSLLSSSKDEVAKLGSALSSWGCIQVINHGISSTFLDEVREMSKEFFKLPLEEKEKYSDKGGQLEGYGNTNGVQQGSLNWNDKLHLLVHPQEKRQFEYWPNKPQNFRETLEEYSMKIKSTLEKILKAMAISLKLEENRFFELWNAKEDHLHARFNFYPRCPNNSDRVLGLKAHADGTAITLLLQDKDVEALQILKNNQWFRVPIIPEALVINLGDQMEIASNGIFKSPVHKVMINPQYDRISLAMLSIPNPEKEIGPLNELINEDRPQVYKRLKDYGSIYTQSIPSGERPIDLAKISN